MARRPGRAKALDPRQLKQQYSDLIACKVDFEYENSGGSVLVYGFFCRLDLFRGCGSGVRTENFTRRCGAKHAWTFPQKRFDCPSVQFRGMHQLFRACTVWLERTILA
jgi:hypothetical protein